MSAAATSTTVAEFLKLPEPKAGHYELHHGEVVLMAPPKWGHTQIQERIRQLFEKLIEDRGVVLVELGFQPSSDYEFWRADVGVVRKQRADQIKADEYLQGAPDIVVEVLSPSNTADEINEKRAVSLEHGCSSFWVVDAKRKEVNVTEGDITRRYAQPTAIPSDIVGGSISITDIFRGL